MSANSRLKATKIIGQRKAFYRPRRDNSIPYMGVWYIYRDTEKSREKETS